MPVERRGRLRPSRPRNLEAICNWRSRTVGRFDGRDDGLSAGNRPDFPERRPGTASAEGSGDGFHETYRLRKPLAVRSRFRRHAATVSRLSAARSNALPALPRFRRTHHHRGGMRTADEPMRRLRGRGTRLYKAVEVGTRWRFMRNRSS